MAAEGGGLEGRGPGADGPARRGVQRPGARGRARAARTRSTSAAEPTATRCSCGATCTRPRPGALKIGSHNLLVPEFYGRLGAAGGAHLHHLRRDGPAPAAARGQAIRARLPARVRRGARPVRGVRPCGDDDAAGRDRAGRQRARTSATAWSRRRLRRRTSTARSGRSRSTTTATRRWTAWPATACGTGARVREALRGRAGAAGPRRCAALRRGSACTPRRRDLGGRRLAGDAGAASLVGDGLRDRLRDAAVEHARDDVVLGELRSGDHLGDRRRRPRASSPR